MSTSNLNIGSSENETSNTSGFGGTTQSSNGNMQSSQLMDLFEDELKDIYWAEKALTKAIPSMIENATSPELIDALTSHLQETNSQIIRLEHIFASIDVKADDQKCEAMEGLIKEAESIMVECEKGSIRDAGIIAAGQKVEHYEIATYGTLRQFAETLGLEDVADLLQMSLDEEKAADETLTEIAVSVVNLQAVDNDQEAVEEAGEDEEEEE